jgi:uncharacterized glyoxalase superfamily protein PhnB
MKQAFAAREKEQFPTPDGKIMHAEVKIGDPVIMLGDSSAEFEPTRSSIHLYVEDVDATYERAIKAGGTSLRAGGPVLRRPECGREGPVRQPVVAGDAH